MSKTVFVSVFQATDKAVDKNGYPAYAWYRGEKSHDLVKEHWRKNYNPVAVFRIEGDAFVDERDALERAFVLTQHVDEDWRHQRVAGVTLMMYQKGDKVRSTSVGDIMTIVDGDEPISGEGKTFVVASFGFNELK